MASTTQDVFAKARGHERADQLRMAREADLLPYFRTLEGPAGPVVEMEGAERIMLGSNNYLGLTGDERVIQGAADALHTFGTGLTGSRLLNGTISLHLELEQEIAEWMGTEEALVCSTGAQANLTALGTLLAPGDTVVVDSGIHASIMDGCILGRAKLRAFRHNKMDKLERTLGKAQQDGGGILVVVDGVFSMEGDVAPLPQIATCASSSARGSWSTRRTARACSARAAPGPRSCMASRTASTCGWGRSRRASRAAAAFSPARTRSSTICASRAARSSSRPPGCRRRSARRSPPCTSSARRRARRCSRACSTTPRTCTPGCSAHGFKVVEHEGDAMTPIVPVIVGDDWKAVLLWKALYDAGVFVNVAIHPAVPPGGALLRTSVMATHDRPTLDRALDAFATVKASFEAEHGPLPS